MSRPSGGPKWISSSGARSILKLPCAGAGRRAHRGGRPLRAHVRPTGSRGRREPTARARRGRRLLTFVRVGPVRLALSELRVARAVARPTRRCEPDDVLESAVGGDRPLATRVTMDDRAVFAPVLVPALRRRRNLEDDLDPLDLFTVGRVLLTHGSPLLVVLPQRGRIACATLDDPGWRRASLALQMPKKTVPTLRGKLVPNVCDFSCARG